MKLIEFNLNPTNRQVKQFGVICLVALPLVGWLWGASLLTLAWLSGIGVLCAFSGFVFPAAVKPLFVALSLVATPIGLVLSELMLMLIYLLLFVPTGLIFRLWGRDALETGLDRTVKTYWRAKRQPRNVESYYRQS